MIVPNYYIGSKTSAEWDRLFDSTTRELAIETENANALVKDAQVVIQELREGKYDGMFQKASVQSPSLSSNGGNGLLTLESAAVSLKRKTPDLENTEIVSRRALQTLDSNSANRHLQNIKTKISGEKIARVCEQESIGPKTPREKVQAVAIYLCVRDAQMTYAQISQLFKISVPRIAKIYKSVSSKNSLILKVRRAVAALPA